MTDQVQLLGISNAIVDVLAHVGDDIVEKIGVVPGSMNLIDEQRAHEIYDLMGPATEMSGGSVANTIAGFANLGGRAAYIGRVRDDQLGEQRPADFCVGKEVDRSNLPGAISSVKSSITTCAPSASTYDWSPRSPAHRPPAAIS